MVVQMEFRRQGSFSSGVSSLSTGSSLHDKPDDDSRYLRLKSVPIYGRERSTLILRQAFQRVSQGPSSEVVLVHGSAGCGKSSLVEWAMRNYVSASGFYVEGKFDKQRMKEPYGAIVHAFTDLCDLLSQNRDVLPEVQQNFASLFTDSDLGVMTQLIGNLQYILPPPSRAASIQSSLGEEGAMGSTLRLERLCQLFVRAVATPTHPVTIFLDDLQFCDHTSLQILRAMTSDIESKHVLFIFAARSEFAFPRSTAPSIPINTLHIEDLTLDSVDDIISFLTRISKGARTMEFADVIHTKTHGNVQHVLRFLEECYSADLLRYSADRGVFNWDLSRIRSETSISPNVVDLVARKLSRLHPHVSAVLRVAAYLGFHFDVPVLSMLVQNELGDIVHNRLARVLEAGMNEGIIEAATPVGRYKFSHDRMQSVLYEMLPEGKEREMLHMKIGMTILENFHQDFHIFLATDHLGRGRRYIDETYNIRIAELGLEAGKLAFRKSAFALAEESLQFGVSMLPRDCWTSDYALSLELHSTLAEIGECTGNFGLSNKVIEAVLNNGTNMKDKLRAYHAFFDHCRAEGKFEDAIRMARFVLQNLGQPFPKSPTKAHVASDMTRVKLSLRKMTTDDIYNLPVTLNSVHIQKLRLLNIMATSACYSNKQEIFTLACLRMIRQSLKKGLTKYSAYGFGCFAVLQIFMDNHDQAYRYALLALKLLEKLKSRMVEVQVFTMCHHLVMHWKRPFAECFNELSRAHLMGMDMGDLDNAFSSAVGAFHLAHHAGAPLSETDQKMRNVCMQSLQYNQNEVLRSSLPFWQLVMNLAGRNERPPVLEGEAIDILNRVHRQSDRSCLSCRLEFAARIAAAYYFEDWVEVREMLPLVDGRHGPPKAHYSFYECFFVCTLSYLGLFRRTNEKKFKAKARQKLKEMQKWVNEGAINMEPALEIVRAEFQSLESKEADTLDLLYRRAAECARAMGFLQQQAIAHELASNVLKDLGSQEKLRVHISCATELYKNWGSNAKAEMMEIKFSEALAEASAQTE